MIEIARSIILPGCKDIKIRKFEFVPKTQFLWCFYGKQKINNFVAKAMVVLTFLLLTHKWWLLVIDYRLQKCKYLNFLREDYTHLKRGVQNSRFPPLLREQRRNIIVFNVTFIFLFKHENVIFYIFFMIGIY